MVRPVSSSWKELATVHWINGYNCYFQVEPRTCSHPYAAFASEGIPEYIMCTYEKCSFFVFSHVVVHADSSNLNEIRKGFNNYTMLDCLISNDVRKIIDSINAFSPRNYPLLAQLIITKSRFFMVPSLNSLNTSQNACWPSNVEECCHCFF